MLPNVAKRALWFICKRTCSCNMRRLRSSLYCTSVGDTSGLHVGQHVGRLRPPYAGGASRRSTCLLQATPFAIAVVVVACCCCCLLLLFVLLLLLFVLLLFGWLLMDGGRGGGCYKHALNSGGFKPPFFGVGLR